MALAAAATAVPAQCCQGLSFMLRDCAFVLRICFAHLFAAAGRAFLPAAVVLLGYVMAALKGTVPYYAHGIARRRVP